MKSIALCLSLGLMMVCSTSTKAQHHYLDTVNLIPNGSFEEFTSFPLGWFYKGRHYTDLVRFWSSPTITSPDVYGPDVLVPEGWKKNGFGEARPYDGKAMSGITVYGCESGKPHCREYIQVPLKEPLVKSQWYTLEFRYLPLERSLCIDKLGVQFNSEPIHLRTEDQLDNTNAHYLGSILTCDHGQWGLFKYEFKASDAYQYAVIGNFEGDSSVQSSSMVQDPLPFGYYYIDDVQLRKIPPIIGQKDKATRLVDREIYKGQTIRLENIYFDLDKTDFHPKSFGQLNDLYQLMCRYPNMQIEIRGHTDDQGAMEYNEALSNDRARAVAEYLLGRGILMKRISYVGLGSNYPSADNATSIGRQQNRRVEFLIEHM